MRRYLNTLVFLLTLITMPVQAADMHALMVIDSDSDADFYLDYLRVAAELETACLSTGMRMRERLFSGRQFRMTVLNQYLSMMKVQKDDVIVFYYSGHGFHSKAQETPWPKLDFLWERGSMDMQGIMETLETKGARFLLVLSDTCNNFIGGSLDFALRQVKSASPLKMEEAYRRLFLDVRGHLYMTSSDVGEYSYVTRYGSVFTNAFLASLLEELEEEAPIWESIVQKSYERCVFDTTKPGFDNTQHPVFSLNIY